MATLEELKTRNEFDAAILTCYKTTNAAADDMLLTATDAKIVMDEIERIARGPVDLSAARQCADALTQFRGRKNAGKLIERLSAVAR